MYDILQLNDMLLPELLDVADGLHIENPKKLDKQELIYKILDKQAITGNGSTAKVEAGEKPRRRRIVKATTPNTVEEAVVEDTGVTAAVAEEKKPAKTAALKKDEKPRRGRKKAEEQPVIADVPDETLL